MQIIFWCSISIIFQSHRATKTLLSPHRFALAIQCIWWLFVYRNAEKARKILVSSYALSGRMRLSTRKLYAPMLNRNERQNDVRSEHLQTTAPSHIYEYDEHNIQRTTLHKPLRIMSSTFNAFMQNARSTTTLVKSATVRRFGVAMIRLWRPRCCCYVKGHIHTSFTWDSPEIKTVSFVDR